MFYDDLAFLRLCCVYAGCCALLQARFSRCVRSCVFATASLWRSACLARRMCEQVFFTSHAPRAHVLLQQYCISLRATICHVFASMLKFHDCLRCLGKPRKCLGNPWEHTPCVFRKLPFVVSVVDVNAVSYTC